MNTKLAIIVAAALAIVTTAWQAQATPLAAAKQVYQAKQITLIAEHCGRGWHWSYALRRCVP